MSAEDLGAAKRELDEARAELAAAKGARRRAPMKGHERDAAELECNAASARYSKASLAYQEAFRKAGSPTG